MMGNDTAKTVFRNAAILYAAAVLLFLVFAIPGLIDPELLMRIDSATYLGPAYSMLETGAYKSSPEAAASTGLRVPLYPCLLAFSLFLGSGSLRFCIVMNVLFSALSVPVLYLAARKYIGKEFPAICAAVLLMLMPTGIAFAPMFLSEGLFVTWVVFSIYFLLRYADGKRRSDLLLTALAAGAGALTRPLNILWIFPCLFVIFFIPGLCWKKALNDGIFALLVFLCIVLPWIFRNKSIGSGWRIDEVSADSLRHNAAVVESRVNGIPAQYYRDHYEAVFRDEFKDKSKYPDRDACLTFEEKHLGGILMRHKTVYFTMIFNPLKLFPDVPTFLENLGLTTGNQGTWDVIVKDGLIAGIRHYFRGKMYLPFLLFPLILLQFAVYCGAFCGLIREIYRKKWFIPLCFCLFSVYYLAVTGPVSYPRFQLPAMPFLCIMAADFFCGIMKNTSKEKQE